MGHSLPSLAHGPTWGWQQFGGVTVALPPLGFVQVGGSGVGLMMVLMILVLLLMMMMIFALMVLMMMGGNKGCVVWNRRGRMTNSF
jgi:hypothetical protein